MTTDVVLGPSFFGSRPSALIGRDLRFLIQQTGKEKRVANRPMICSKSTKGEIQIPFSKEQKRVEAF